MSIPETESAYKPIIYGQQTPNVSGQKEPSTTNIEWYIFKTYRGNGYAKEAVTALANKAFDHKLFEMYEGVKADIMKKHFANIDIIRATIRVSNIASQRTALSCGFNEQYLDRRHAIVNENTFEDCIIYDLER